MEKKLLTDDCSFEHIEKKIREYAERSTELPLQALLMHRMQMHMTNRMLEARNRILSEHHINETLFMSLIIIDAQDNKTLQPSELSVALGTSRTNATRIADDLVKNGWINRYSDEHDRRCIYLQLNEAGERFINAIRPKQFANLTYVWDVLDKEEQVIYEKLSRKILNKIDDLHN